MQRYRVVILIVLLGVVPVVAAFFAALSFLKGEAAKPAPVEPVSVVAKAPPPPEPPETRKVLAAARPLPVGTLLGEEDFTELALDLGAVRTAHIIAGDAMRPDALRGYALRETLATGQAFTWPAVVGPGQRGFLAAVLRAGRRAVTVRVGPATGHAGLIDPGDRVDVILSAELQAGERERSVLTRTIVEDVRVVAVDRRLGSGTGSTGGDGVVERTEMVTATLEVSPSQGDRLVLAEHEGRLSLAVRSLAAGASRPSSAALELRDLLLSPEAVDASVREDRLREELAMMEERLRVAEEERLRLEERDRRRCAWSRSSPRWRSGTGGAWKMRSDGMRKMRSGGARRRSGCGWSRGSVWRWRRRSGCAWSRSSPRWRCGFGRRGKPPPNRRSGPCGSCAAASPRRRSRSEKACRPGATWPPAPFPGPRLRTWFTKVPEE